MDVNWGETSCAMGLTSFSMKMGRKGNGANRQQDGANRPKIWGKPEKIWGELNWGEKKVGANRPFQNGAKRKWGESSCTHLES